MSSALLIAGCASVPSASVDRLSAALPITYIYAHPDARAFTSRLTESLSKSIAAYDVAEVSRLFAGLPRSEMSRSDLFEIKFGYQQWRHAVRNISLQALLHAEQSDPVEEHLVVLSKLSQSVDVEDLGLIRGSLQKWSESSNYQRLIDLFIDLVLIQGDSRISTQLLDGLTWSDGSSVIPSDADGPDKWIRIPPSYKSAWPFERWAQFEEFADYSRSEGIVSYRGIEFRSGDTLIINLQNPSEGLFTLVLEDRNYSPHMGIFVEVETERGVYPVVFEIHQLGVRLVPLQLFLSDSISAYVEVFRLRDAPSNWTDNLSNSVLEIIAEEQGFNLFADDGHRDGNHYLTCVTAVQYLVAKSGIDLEYPDPSAVSPLILANVKPLGFQTSAYLSPTDILRWDEIELVGIVDNGGYIDNVTRQLVNERLRERMSESPLSLDGATFRFVRWASRLVLQETPVMAPLLRSAFGYSKANFPMGTAELLAFMELIQGDIHRSVNNLKPSISAILADYPYRDSFSIHALIDDVEVRRLTDKAMAPIDRWF